METDAMQIKDHYGFTGKRSVQATVVKPFGIFLPRSDRWIDLRSGDIIKLVIYPEGVKESIIGSLNGLLLPREESVALLIHINQLKATPTLQSIIALLFRPTTVKTSQSISQQTE